MVADSLVTLFLAIELLSLHLLIVLLYRWWALRTCLRLPLRLFPGYVSAEEGGWRQTCQHRFWSVFPGPPETSHQHTPPLSRPRPASYRKVDGSRAETYCDKLPYKSPELTYSRCAFFEAHYIHSFLMDVLVSLHSAYWFSFFFFLLDQIPEVESPGKAAQILHHFISWLSIIYTDSYDDRLLPFSHPSIFDRVWLIPPNTLYSSLSTPDPPQPVLCGNLLPGR